MERWKAKAKCSGLPPDIFIPSSAGGSTMTAKKICNGEPDWGYDPCPVKEECLAYAIENNLQGVFGGQMVYPKEPMNIVVGIQDGRPRRTEE